MEDERSWKLLCGSVARIEKKVDRLAEEVAEIKGGRKFIRSLWMACSASAGLGMFALALFLAAH